MNKVYWSVFEHLFDREHGLFYRDKRFFDAKTSNGREVFWSRGNGWAFAGIPRVLSHLPRENEFRGRYVELLRIMAASLAQRQGEDGLWRSNLDDPDQYPNPETSGSSFFCYGLAWGINEGLLDKAVYLPVVVKAWNGLKRHIHPDGKLGYVQRVAGAPGGATRDDTHEYAMYALHTSKKHYYRMSIPGDPTEWGLEHVYDYPAAISYMNLYYHQGYPQGRPTASAPSRASLCRRFAERGMDKFHRSGSTGEGIYRLFCAKVPGGPSISLRQLGRRKMERS